ncbi:MAG: hypothetical protein AB7L91_03610 [Dehalococcoidia bacterium]
MGFMKRAMVSAAVAGIALALLLLPAGAADELDQHVDVTPPEGRTNWDGVEGINAIDVLRQTFTPEQESLSKVALYLVPDGVAATTGDVFVTVEVKRVGVGTVVASDIVLVPSGTAAGWVTFDFPTVAIEMGVQYAIEATVNDDSFDLAWGYSNSAAYAGGTGATVAGGLLFPKTYDFLFQTYYEPVEEPPEEECGTILFGSVPPAGGGFGTFALNCGDLADLVTASGCPQATSAFFYNKPNGSFAVYIPGTGVAAVNAEFIGIFNGDPDIDEPTIFTAKCK